MASQNLKSVYHNFCNCTKAAFASKRNFICAVPTLLQVIERVDSLPALYANEVVLRNDTRRYEHLWLPMLANMSVITQRSLVPPMDIEWV